MRDEMMDELDTVIRALKDHIQNILPEQAERVIGGKMLRGTLVILIAEAFNGKKNREKALDLATAIEVIHACSLDVDDALDDDMTRRGKKALYLTMSKKEMMLDTIYRLSIPYGLICKYGKDYVKKTAECQEGMSKGVLDEIKSIWTEKGLPATSIYMNVLTKKTGLLFSLAATFGAMAADADEETVKAFETFGLHLGIAYQVSDDISDLSAVILGEKKAGTELLLLKCVHMDTLFKELVADIKAKKVHPSKALELLHNDDLQSRMMDIVNKEREHCMSSIAEIEIDERYKSFLVAYPRFCVDAILGEV